MKNRYHITHPETVTLSVANMQRAGDYLFNFKNSPDLNNYVIHDIDDDVLYSVEYNSTLGTIEITRK